jgi:hypothetical protein
MSKTTTLPKLEDYKAPWEVDSDGNDIPEDEQQVDTGKLKKFLHGLLSDKARLQTTVATVTGERDTLKTELETKTREGEGDEDKRKREHDAEVKKAKDEGDLKALKLEVALDVDGITPAQAKRIASRLTGTTREELEEDAKGLAEDFNIGKKAAEGGDGEETEGETSVTPSSRPRVPRASGDPNPTAPRLPNADSKSINEHFPRR